MLMLMMTMFQQTRDNDNQHDDNDYNDNDADSDTDSAGNDTVSTLYLKQITILEKGMAKSFVASVLLKRRFLNDCRAHTQTINIALCPIYNRLTLSIYVYYQYNLILSI